MRNNLSKITHFFILSCAEATLLMEKKLNGELTFGQIIRLKSHLAVCKWCRSYNRKSHLLQEALQKIINSDSEKQTGEQLDTQKLTAGIEKKLKNKLS
ncbi:zf-HC2 domain-containing protein [Empedobacter brevis]|uniref:zf-HC2 domain-containing protein n=1 Tax=Empedobacter brevis TaxID=247 RepID=UPI003340C66E